MVLKILSLKCKDVMCRYYIPRYKRRCKLKAMKGSEYCWMHLSRRERGDSFGLASPEDIPELDDCAVCLEPFFSTNKTLACGHKIHMKCVIESGQARCPLCRAYVEIKGEQNIRKFEKKRKEFRDAINPLILRDELAYILLGYIGQNGRHYY